MPAESWPNWQALCLTGTFRCPHCFTLYRRPVEWIGRMAWVNRLFSYNRAPSSGPSVVEQHRAEGYQSFDRRMSRFARRFERLERQALTLLAQPFLWLGHVLLRLTGGGRRRRSSRSSSTARSIQRRLWLQSWVNWLTGNRRR